MKGTAHRLKKWNFQHLKCYCNKQTSCMPTPRLQSAKLTHRVHAGLTGACCEDNKSIYLSGMQAYGLIDHLICMTVL